MTDWQWTLLMSILMYWWKIFRMVLALRRIHQGLGTHLLCWVIGALPDVSDSQPTLSIATSSWLFTQSIRPWPILETGAPVWNCPVCPANPLPFYHYETIPRENFLVHRSVQVLKPSKLLSVRGLLFCVSTWLIVDSSNDGGLTRAAPRDTKATRVHESTIHLPWR